MWILQRHLQDEDGRDVQAPAERTHKVNNMQQSDVNACRERKVLGASWEIPPAAAAFSSVTRGRFMAHLSQLEL